mmetsp:Transcript_106761/g.339983  ORF Transcript_106761/g.339983 Transcript_106761/m.339983 type:complete len:207 (-) Transcript_106761:1089-1709(-)
MQAAGWRAEASAAARSTGSRGSRGRAAKRWARQGPTLPPQLSQSRGTLQSLWKVSRVASLPCRPCSRTDSERSFTRAPAASPRHAAISRGARRPPKEDTAEWRSNTRPSAAFLQTTGIAARMALCASRSWRRAASSLSSSGRSSRTLSTASAVSRGSQPRSSPEISAMAAATSAGDFILADRRKCASCSRCERMRTRWLRASKSQR